MRISDNIPKMELKADREAQAWARSARNVLMITQETIAETLEQANKVASMQQGKPLFCMPYGKTLDPITMGEILSETYKRIPGQPNDKDKMRISEVAWLGIMQAYPCQTQHAQPKVSVLHHQKRPVFRAMALGLSSLQG